MDKADRLQYDMLYCYTYCSKCSTILTLVQENMPNWKIQHSLTLPVAILVQVFSAPFMVQPRNPDLTPTEDLEGSGLVRPGLAHWRGPWGGRKGDEL